MINNDEIQMNAIEDELQVRGLKTLDFFKIAKIVAKIGGNVIKEMREDMTEMQAGMLLFTQALQSAEDETMEWLADIAGKTKEEFAELDFEAPLIVIEKLVEKEDMQRFFERVRGLTAKFLPKQ